MKIISQEPWSYVLFDDGQGWVLTFMVGEIVEVGVCVRLTPEEIDLIKVDKEHIENIIRNLVHDRKARQAREIIPPIWPTQ